MNPLYVDSTTGEVGCQEDFSLVDGSRDWKGRKKMSIKVAGLMEHYDKEKALELKRCGTYLGFIRTPDNGLKLSTANFCRQRLCPMCQWRRSLRLAVQSDKVYRELSQHGYRHIFMTVTMRNCKRGELRETVDHLYKSMTAFMRSVAFRRSFAGAYRAFEVTYNKDKNTFHPHWHLLLTVRPEYFEDESLYWDIDTLIKRWRKSAHLDYDPDVDITVVRQKPGQSITSACVELCKYPVKSAEINSWSVLQEIDEVLKGRRLLGWWGVTAETRRALALDDVEDGDLVHTDDELVAKEDELAKIVYVWRHGLYIPLDVKELKNGEA